MAMTERVKYTPAGLVKPGQFRVERGLNGGVRFSVDGKAFEVSPDRAVEIARAILATAGVGFIDPRLNRRQ